MYVDEDNKQQRRLGGRFPTMAIQDGSEFRRRKKALVSWFLIGCRPFLLRRRISKINARERKKRRALDCQLRGHGGLVGEGEGMQGRGVDTAEGGEKKRRGVAEKGGGRG